MMTFGRIATYVDAEPFRPFRINMASGRSFEIRHPEMIFLGRRTIRVFTFMNENPDEANEHEHELSLTLIESIEPLDVAAGRKDGA
jgi:hypothetical protein